MSQIQYFSHKLYIFCKVFCLRSYQFRLTDHTIWPDLSFRYFPNRLHLTYVWLVDGMKSQMLFCIHLAALNRTRWPDVNPVPWIFHKSVKLPEIMNIPLDLNVCKEQYRYLPGPRILESPVGTMKGHMRPWVLLLWFHYWHWDKNQNGWNTFDCKLNFKQLVLHLSAHVFLWCQFQEMFVRCPSDFQ